MPLSETEVQAPIRHLYVHLPFCAHRCGYCDFVTVVGRPREHGPYVEAVLAELDQERPLLAETLETAFVGGGTPTFTARASLRLLLQSLPRAAEVTVEANPETVTDALADVLREQGVTRVSLGAQSFQPHLLEVLERRATPDDVRGAVHQLRDAGFDNVSLDLVYGIPGQSDADLDRDLAEACSLAPEHLSWYELEAKPGTRFTVRHGIELARQAEAMEGYFERVVDSLTGAGYRWYETANFCLEGERARDRDLRARHNLAYWQGADYLGVGMGAVSTLGSIRRRNQPSLARYVGALARGGEPPRELEPLDARVKAVERVMLGLRLDEPFVIARSGTAATGDPGGMLDLAAARRLAARGLVRCGRDSDGNRTLSLTRRGRFLGDGVTAELLR